MPPLAAEPISTGSWLAAMAMVAPDSKPCSTGTDSSAASACRRSSAAAPRNSPTSAASTSAASLGLTPAGASCSVCMIISANTATGPMFRKGLEPNAA